MTFISSPNSKNYKVLVFEKAYLSILESSLKYYLSTGNLAGYKKKDLIFVSEAKHFIGTNKKNKGISFKDEDYIKLANWEDDIFSREPPLFIVGWYKTWIGGFKPKDYDITTQLGKQDINPEAFMIICNSNKVTEKDPGFRIIRFKDFKDISDFELEYLDFKVEFTEKNQNKTFIQILKELEINILL